MMRNLIALSLLVTFAWRAAAERNFLNLIRVEADAGTTLDELVDDFTVEYVRQLIDEDDELEGAAVTAVPGGYVIHPHLIVDLSQLPAGLRDQLIAQLGRVFVGGEPWRGLTYRFAPGRLGLTSDIAATSDRVEQLYAVTPPHEELDLSQVCDHWLGQAH